jgi:hypothetical protein
MSDCYILGRKKKAIKCTVEQWASWLESIRGTNKKNVGKKSINGKRVSTVFLGLDHAYSEEQKPQIFETMVFSGSDYNEIYMQRYSNYKQAKKGHRKAVKWVSLGCWDDYYNKPKPSRIIRNKQKSIKIIINK